MIHFQLFQFSRRFLVRFLILILILLSTNCAIFQKKNLVLVNAVEENLVPDDSSAKIWASPFYIPVGILAGALDVLLVHPISVIPKSADDTIDLLWSKNEDLGYVTRMGIVPISALLTAPIFIISWSYHWFFEDSGETHYNPKSNKMSANEWVSALDQALKDNEIERVGELLDNCVSRKRSPKEIQVLMKVYNQFKLNTRVYHAMNSVQCMLWNAKYNPEIEDFLVDIFIKDNKLPMIYENRENLVYYFVQYKSQKGSKALFQMLSDETLDVKWIPFIVNKLFEFGYEEERNEIINRIQRKKISI